LKQNLTGLEDRYILHKNAVSGQSGKLEFGTETTGRYGGLGIETGNIITVECLEINSVIKKILQQHDVIDILKIDTEGVEVRTLTALEPKYAAKIKRIYIEADPETDIHPDIFLSKQYGSVCGLMNKNY
jgi:FkbM family methyltransferase